MPDFVPKVGESQREEGSVLDRFESQAQMTQLSGSSKLTEKLARYQAPEDDTLQIHRISQIEEAEPEPSILGPGDDADPYGDS